MENNREGCSLSFHEFQANHDGFLFPDPASASAAMSWPLPPVQDNLLPSFPSFPPLPPLPPPAHHHHLYPFYGDMYARQSSTDPLGLAGFYMGSEALARAGGMSSSTSPFGVLHAELNKMTAQEIMDAKALAASKSHSEAERRRRERINAHLAKLRSLLPSTTKTDKASLLAEVIQHVKELKRQSSEIAEENPLPTESDELTVDATSDEDGRLLVRASLCCEDRSDLLPELIKALKALHLRALKAEITTLGGRVKNVLVITGEAGEHSVESIQDALKAVMERAAADEQTSTSGTKRQRTTHLSTILEHSSL